MHSTTWKRLLLTLTICTATAGAAIAEEIRFDVPVPAMLRTRSNTRIYGTLLGLSPRVVHFRSNRGRELKLKNFEVRYLISNDKSFRYRPGVDRFSRILASAKKLNEVAKQQAAVRAAQAEAAAKAAAARKNGNENSGIPGGMPGGFGGMPGGNSEPPPSSGIGNPGNDPPGTIPGSQFPGSRTGSRFGRTGINSRTGGRPGFPGNRNGRFGGMNPGGSGTIPGGMPPGGMPPGGNDYPSHGSNPNPNPGSGFSGSRFGGMPGADPSGMPDQHAGTGIPGSFSRPEIPSYEPPQMPNMEFKQPDIPTGPSSYSQKACSNCNRIIPDHITAGDNCPHCGVHFSYDEKTGKRASPLAVGGGIFGVIAVLSLIGFVVRKMTS